MEVEGLHVFRVAVLAADLVAPRVTEALRIDQQEEDKVVTREALLGVHLLTVLHVPRRIHQLQVLLLTLRDLRIKEVVGAKVDTLVVEAHDSVHAHSRVLARVLARVRIRAVAVRLAEVLVEDHLVADADVAVETVDLATNASMRHALSTKRSLLKRSNTSPQNTHLRILRLLNSSRRRLLPRGM